jgi:hypothetical protein
MLSYIRHCAPDVQNQACWCRLQTCAPLIDIVKNTQGPERKLGTRFEILGRAQQAAVMIV